MEIERNIPKLDMYSEESFIKNLSKFDISLSKLDKYDSANISKLDRTFISFIKQYGYEHNKSYIYNKIIDGEKLNSLISFRETFFGVVILAHYYVVYYPKDNTLIPIVTTSFEDAIPQKLAYIF